MDTRLLDDRRLRALATLVAGALGLVLWLGKESGSLAPRGALEDRPIPERARPGGGAPTVLPVGRRPQLSLAGEALPVASQRPAGLDPATSEPSTSEPSREGRDYAEFRRWQADQPGRLEREAVGLLRSDEPDSRKRALVRALIDGDSPALEQTVELLLRECQAGSDERGLALPDFTLERLGRLARPGRSTPDAGSARALLFRCAWGDLRASEPDLRRRAATHYAAAASGGELQRLAALLEREEDALLVASVRSVLGTNPDRAGVEALFGALPGPDSPPDEAAP